MIIPEYSDNSLSNRSLIDEEIKHETLKIQSSIEKILELKNKINPDVKGIEFKYLKLNGGSLNIKEIF